MSNFNPNHLKPGDRLETKLGKAEFVRFKPNNLKGQTYQVRFLSSGKLHWFTLDQLRQANRDANREEVEV